MAFVFSAACLNAGETEPLYRVSGSNLSDADKEKIEKALPEKACVSVAEPRKLLVFDRNVGYPGHPSIHYANFAFSRMGEKTGAFTVKVSSNPKVFEKETLMRFDAVFLNNTVGNLFTDPKLRANLVEFVSGGGGLMGVHGTTVAFTRWPGAREDWPEFGIMLGGRGARHRESREQVHIKLDSPAHPLNAPFGGKGFSYRDEFFRVHGTYSRDRVRVLFSIDTEKTDLSTSRYRQERADNDYALAWVRNYGRGRVFYCTIAHNPSVFFDPLMLEFYLGAVQFVCGDLKGSTIPSSRLNAAARAQEKLGLRLGMTAYSLHKYTFFETIEKTRKLGLNFIGGLSFQKVGGGIEKNFTPDLTGGELEKVRLKLDAEGLRLLTYYIHDIPADEAACRRIFEFARKLGIEAFLSEPKPAALDTIEKFCDEYGIKVAIHNHGEKTSPHYWHPEKLMEVCRNRSSRIGACADVGYWIRSGIDPVAGVKLLGERLLVLQLHDLHEKSAAGHDVPWGTGVGETGKILEEIRRLGIKPVMIGLEYSYDWFDNMPEMAQCVEFFHRFVLKSVN